MRAVVLLVNTSQGSIDAVRFADGEAARAWEDAHPEVEVFGIAPLSTRREVLEDAR